MDYNNQNQQNQQNQYTWQNQNYNQNYGQQFIGGPKVPNRYMNQEYNPNIDYGRPMMPVQMPYQQAPANKTNGLGIASLILGIVGLLFICCFIGIVPCAIGLVLGIIAMFKKDASKGQAIAGIVCSAVGILIFILMIIFMMVVESEPTDDAYVLARCNVGETVYVDDVAMMLAEVEKYDAEYTYNGKPYATYEFTFNLYNYGEAYFDISWADFDCYADGSYEEIDGFYSDEDIELAPGATVSFTVCVDVPAEAEDVILEYNIGFWVDEVVVFVAREAGTIR